MFLQLSVILFTGMACMAGGLCGGACEVGDMRDGGTHGRGRVWQGACMAGEACMAEVGMRDSRRDSHYSGRYASYWNAFFFYLLIQSLVVDRVTRFRSSSVALEKLGSSADLWSE